LLPYIQLFF